MGIWLIEFEGMEDRIKGIQIGPGKFKTLYK